MLIAGEQVRWERTNVESLINRRSGRRRKGRGSRRTDSVDSVMKVEAYIYKHPAGKKKKKSQ